MHACLLLTVWILISVHAWKKIPLDPDFFFQNSGGGGARERNVRISTKKYSQSNVLFILINGAACENNLQLEYQLDSDNGYALFSKKKPT